MTNHPDFDAGLDAARGYPPVPHLRAPDGGALCGREGVIGDDLIDERDLAYRLLAETTCLRCLRAAREQLEAA